MKRTAALLVVLPILAVAAPAQTPDYPPARLLPHRIRRGGAVLPRRDRGRGGLAGEPRPASRRSRPRQVPLRGGRSGQPAASLYSRGFASIFGEWETTEEARSRFRTFHESAAFPRAPGSRPGHLEEARRRRALPGGLVGRGGSRRPHRGPDRPSSRRQPVGGARERAVGGEGRPAPHGRRLHRRGDGQVAPRRPAVGGPPLRHLAVPGAPGRLQRLGAGHPLAAERCLPPLGRGVPPLRPARRPTTPSGPSATCWPSTTGGCGKRRRRLPTTPWSWW